MSHSPCIVWFRNDLRLHDNPALQAALESGQPIVAIYIYSPTDEGMWPIGGASQWWLHHALADLKQQLEQRGNTLHLFHGSAVDVLPELCRTWSVQQVFYNRRYEPHSIRVEEHLQNRLTEHGVRTQSFQSSLLFEPWHIQNQQGKPFQVFSAFWRHALTLGLQRKTLSAPSQIPRAEISPHTSIGGVPLEALQLLPAIPWDSEFYTHWIPTEAGAQQELTRFLSDAVSHYATQRDWPATHGTSLMSPYLHFGQISPRHIVAETQAAIQQHGPARQHGSDVFIKEVGWREFAQHLLYHFPQTDTTPLRPEFKHFPWENHPNWVSAWQRGETGYPIVDAGMRQLWKTGWMHNRVRMIVASFLIKDLFTPWQSGAQWFWDTLVDANLASNTMGWQWTAGCGADAAPYFRVFNPVLQGEKFDPQGTYIRRWIPELAPLPNKLIHRPWEATPLTLLQANITLGQTYPHPIVDHAEARQKALAAFSTLKAHKTPQA